MRKLVILIALTGASLAHVGQIKADAIRGENSNEEYLGFVPSGDLLSWVSMGFETQIADWIWLRSVLVFADNSDDGDPRWQDWLERSLNVSVRLDPEWHSLYSYGGLMLKVVGDVDASSRLLQKGLKQFPQDHYFAFSLGANHYLQRETASALPLETGVEVGLSGILRSERPWGHPFGEGLHDSVESRSSLLMATQWMLHASTLEGAPAWYAGAAHSFLAKTSEREVAIRFLTEQLEKETDERLVESLTAQLNVQLHDFHSEKLTALLLDYKEDLGRLPLGLEELVKRGLLTRIPTDPYVSGWVIDKDEVVRSRRVVQQIVEAALATERRMLIEG